jgi:hypothetical protein
VFKMSEELRSSRGEYPKVEVGANKDEKDVRPNLELRRVCRSEDNSIHCPITPAEKVKSDWLASQEDYYILVKACWRSET